jgi:hypothetical protein
MALEKMKIIAYKKPDLTDKVGEFIALINPETYSLDYKVLFNDGQAQGTSTKQQKYTLTAPEEISFEFLFDGSGILDGQEPIDGQTLFEKVKAFREMLTTIDSTSHEPYHLKLGWGTLLFKGRCTALTINYKLFNPDGTPLRAVCKASFKGSIEETLRVAQEMLQSPDLTHYKIIKKGETLPWLCYQVYGDPKYYIQVAAVNKLGNFRNLEAGDEIFFPPINKTNDA